MAKWHYLFLVLGLAAASSVAAAEVWSSSPAMGDPVINQPQDNAQILVLSDVTLSCTPPTDMDTRTEPCPSEQAADAVTITWSASGGSWPEGNTGASVAWIAPAAPGVYTITATADDAGGNPYIASRDDGTTSAQISVCVYTAAAEVRRKGAANFGSSAVIAAGGKDSDVHKAEIKVTAIDTQDQPVVGQTFYLSISDADATGVETDASLSASSGVTGGDGSFIVTYTSGDMIRDANTVNVRASSSPDDPVLASVTIDQKWDADEGLEFNVPEYFVTEIADTCKFTCRLDADTPIDGHAIDWYTTEITLNWYWWNMDTDDEDGDEEEYNYPFTGDDSLVFELDILDLVEYSDGDEDPDGVYAQDHTVYDYFDIVEIEGESVWQEALVMNYDFAVYDNDVYEASE